MAPPTQDRVDPFPPAIRVAFTSMISAPGYVNRERMSYSKWHRIQVFLDQPDLKAENSKDRDIKHLAKRFYELSNDRKLYRRPDIKHIQPRYVVPESEAFDLIIHEHCKLTHSGRDKTWEAVDALFYGITRYEVL